jgi:hypothetical protein
MVALFGVLVGCATGNLRQNPKIGAEASQTGADELHPISPGIAPENPSHALQREIIGCSAQIFSRDNPNARSHCS